MKIIICGTRSFTNYDLLVKTCDHMLSQLNPHEVEIVSGSAEGADQLGEKYAKERGYKVKPFPVSKQEWKTIGKRAGYLRNLKMAEYGDACIAFWDGESPGTKMMIDLAKEHHLKVKVVIYQYIPIG